MYLKTKEEIKIKPMSIEEMLLAVDRLTRFKNPEIKYNRVFKEVMSKFLIQPKISFKAYDTLPPERIKTYVETVFEISIKEFISNYTFDDYLSEKIGLLQKALYETDEKTEILTSVHIPYEKIISLAQNTNELQHNFQHSKNLQFLSQLLDTKNLTPQKIREKYSTKFPIEKVVLVEGITEEILLPKFAKILNYDFDMYGVEIIGAGGKNQVAKEYLMLNKQLKVPIVILLDSDAEAVAKKISAHLRLEDKLILIEKGEFEDILPLKLIKKAVNYKFRNLFKTTVADFSSECGRVKDLEEMYRINGLGEFKKAEFAHNVDSVLENNSTNFISEEIKNIILEIKNI